MASRKKLLTSAVALGTAAALTLGGTFAWQSINQTALNEASDIVNPGGRLHNDQHWVNPLTNDTNIYVENFTDPTANGDTIFARVRLEEYMELVMNYGVDDVASVETVAGAKYRIGEDGAVSEMPDTTQATEKNQYKFEYAIHDFTKDFAKANEGDDDVDTTERNATSEYWTWVTGLTYDDEGNEIEDSRPYFMPTFNKDKDSLLADLNGIYRDTLGGITKREEAQYEDYMAYTADSEAETHFAIYDGDTDKIANVTDRADLDDLIENGENAENYANYSDKIKLVEEEHSVAKVGETKGLIALSDWLALVNDNYNEDDHGGYWVYDDSENGDGWVYWSSPIEAGETTGLLLDSISLNHVMSDTWYYAINVVGQFVTANDLGNSDENKGALTGFYMDGETVSENAEKLLKAIGVEIGEGDKDETGGEDGSLVFTVTDNDGDDTNNPVITPEFGVSYNGTATEFQFAFDGGTGWSWTFIVDSEGYEGALYSVDEDNTTITIKGKDSGTKVATWDKNAHKLTLEQGQTLKSCHIEVNKRIGQGGATCSMPIKELTNTGGAEATALSISTYGDAIDIGSNPGVYIFTATLNGTKLDGDAVGKLSMYFVKVGHSAPESVLSEDEIQYGSYGNYTDVFYGDISAWDLELENGTRKYNVTATYQGDETLTCETTVTFCRHEVELTTEGATLETEVGHRIFVTLPDLEDPVSSGKVTADSIAISSLNGAAYTYEKDEENSTDTCTCYKASSNMGGSLYLDSDNDTIGFDGKGNQYTITITVDGTAYTGTLGFKFPGGVLG